MDAPAPSPSMTLRSALLPALMLGLYFGLFDAVGTLWTGMDRDPAEFTRRVIADILAGVLLAPAGWGEQRLRRLPRAAGRDLGAAAAIVLATATLNLVTFVGAEYASHRRGPGLDHAVLLQLWSDCEPVLPELAFSAVALALPAGVVVLARVHGLRLRWQVALSGAAGLIGLATVHLATPHLFLHGLFLPSQVPALYAAMLAVSLLVPLLFALADRVERRLARGDDAPG
ncbi:MAG: hypothetical protein KF878_33150 [Planctomycetes bacterium]|nr:hypothetical protein [Planctomycetota bacterium]